ncbi:MAG TPA: hypothetical protein VFQ45_01405 [Longimicrobium sp.]|nr:hypothetical protein [Longimicrobium sp.]
MVRRESVNPEEVAALLDGTLPDNERAALMERLARSPEGIEMLAETARLMGRVSDDAPQPPHPPKPRPGWSRRLWVPTVAVLALALLVPFALRRGGGGEGAPLRLDGSTLVAAPGEGSLAAALGTGWEQPGWSVMRGTGAGAANRPGDFRIGVRLVDVEAALDARDAAAVRRVQPELASLLARRQAGSLMAEYQDIGSRAAAPTAKLARDRRHAATGMQEFFRDSPMFAAGVWVEQARLAALARETDYFSAAVAEELATLIGRTREAGARASFVQALERVHALLGDGVAPAELDAVRSALAIATREGAG